MAMAIQPPPELTRQGDTLRVRGTMTLAFARRLEQAAEASLPGGVLTVDLAAVAALDSSALAVLLAWQRRQRRQGGGIVVRGAPEALHTLSRVYGAGEQLRWS